MLIGQRLPFRPPTGAIFAAWLPEEDASRWLEEARKDARADEYRSQLNLVRQRGYSVGLLNNALRAFLIKLSRITNSDYESHHPELQQLIAALAYDPVELSSHELAAVRLVSVPIFDGLAQVTLALTLHGFTKPREQRDILRYIAQARNTAQSLTKAIGGRDPTLVN